MNTLASPNTGEPPAGRRATCIRHWVLRGVAGIVSCIWILIGALRRYDTRARTRVAANYPPPGEFIQVGKARMHYVSQGMGEPTLVLVAGMPGGALDWTPVMPALSARHRVCAFDRLGQDWSDPAPHPRSSGTAADELHAALQELGVVRPIVVGHSLGGALVQIYAARYDVDGAVLIDGVTSSVVDAVADRLGNNQWWHPFSVLGLMRPIMQALDANHAYPLATRTEMLALRARPLAWIDICDEALVAQQTMAAELHAAEPKLEIPLLIIAAGESNVMGLGAGVLARSAKELADRKPKSTYFLIPNAKHYVQAEQPSVVTNAIETWLSTLKQ